MNSLIQYVVKSMLKSHWSENSVRYDSNNKEVFYAK